MRTAVSAGRLGRVFNGSITKSWAVLTGWRTPNHFSGEKKPIAWELPGVALYGGP